jgi:1,2-phenylacetyl-CoA epoxidase PaaB subunit
VKIFINSVAYGFIAGLLAVDENLAMEAAKESFTVKGKRLSVKIFQR